MNYLKELITFIAAIDTVIYLFFGIYVLCLNYRSQLHRIFFYMTLILSYWSFCAYWAYNATEVYYIRNWERISFIAPSLFYALVLHFSINIFRSGRRFCFFTPIIYLPAIYFMFNNFKSYVLYEDFINKNGIWIFKLGSDFSRSYSFIAYAVVYMLISLILLYLHQKRENSYRKRMQLKIYTLTLLSSFVFMLGENIILPKVSGYESSQISMAIYIIWIIGVWYAMIEYRFLKISPDSVSIDMINNILEALILIDDKFRIINVNTRLREITGKSIKDMFYRNICDLIEESDRVVEEINKLEKDGLNSYSSRLHFKTNSNQNALIDARISIVRDRFGGKIGYMLIGSEVKDVKHLKTFYKITSRELDIIQGIVSGLSNKEIAKELNLSEYTIKTHITNIFTKLGVDNRIQLIKLLNSFNLIPNHQADKTVFLIKNRYY